ncbi:MAG: cytidylate kinase-like family protein [Lachnospiraceae bacterium]|nr:cytidylate kinase-like family protein [Lachnospiraceae bacterium]
MRDHFVITIGRQFGSGGKEIGEKLAQKLNVKCYDKELLALAAKDSGLCKEMFEMHDEKPTNSFLYSIVMDTYSGIYNPQNMIEMPINQKVFLAQFDTIKKIADRESCIIVGRCADYALEDLPGLTSIFIHADMESRIKRISEKYEIKENKAKDMIIKTDKRRSSYYNYYTNREWGSASSYNLSIDSGKLGIDKTVQLIENYINII